jgi:hypothetical protein
MGIKRQDEVKQKDPQEGKRQWESKMNFLEINKGNKRQILRWRWSRSQRQEVHIGIIFRWCIAKIFKINFKIKGIWLNIQFKNHAWKRILGSSNNRQTIMQAMIRVSWRKWFPTYDIEKYTWVKPHQEYLLKPRPKKWATKSFKKEQSLFEQTCHLGTR